MKQKVFTLMAMALLVVAQAKAQTAFATLFHEGTLSSFTGVDALSEAMAAAADGDVITLSSGTFNGCTITKAITLRGVGMEADEQGRQTIIKTNNIGISVTDGEEKSVSIEGISMPSITLSVNKTLGSIYLNKCVIKNYTPKSSSTVCANYSVITNCKVQELKEPYTISRNLQPNVNAYNCYFDKAYANKTTYRFDNCVIGSGYNAYGYYPASYYNCILLNVPNFYGTADHCVTTFAIDASHGSNNYQVEDVTTLFNNYDAAAEWYARDLTLTDEAKAKYLGNDGTEVGVYGGSQPFSAKLERPFIKRLNVDSKSRRNGKLGVVIEVDEAY